MKKHAAKTAAPGRNPTYPPLEGREKHEILAKIEANITSPILS